MSKVDAQRAMREAKYARNQAAGTNRREAAAAAAAPTSPPTAAPEPRKRAAPAKKAAAAEPAGTAAVAPQGELCGHRSMNGRSCTRQAGHPEKNHRYG